MQQAIGQEAGGKKSKLHPLTLALAQTLLDNPHPAAARCLTQLAALTEWDDVRDAAVAGLKRRPLDHYVPLLLAALQTPLEADVRFDTDANGNLISKVQLFREGDLTDYSFMNLQTPQPSQFVPANYGNPARESVNSNFYGDGRDMPGNFAAWEKTETPVQLATQKAYPSLVTNWQADEKARYASYQKLHEARKTYPLVDGMRMEAQRQMNARISRTKAQIKADAIHNAIENRNRAIEESNARIVGILNKTTGLDLGEAPLAWWKWWWNQYNESDAIVDADDRSSGDDPYPSPYEPQPYKPVFSSYVVQYYPGFSPAPTSLPSGSFKASSPPTTFAVRSCFAPGTSVWTQMGRLAIEKIKIGDRVLAQDVNTGELAYKPVLAVTVRPPHERIKIGFGAESVIATPGHPFWVNGKNWQMTKQLKVGQILHTVSGGTPIESIEKLETDPSYAGYSYNLIVADFDTYFVGEKGIMVHDNLPRQPTSALIPGLPAEASPAVVRNP